jgi:F420H(2)-dependent quinone reductase
VKAKPKGLDRPSTLRVIKGMSSVHTRMYRASGGRLGKNWRIGSAVREGLWPRLVDLYADFGAHQSWTEREIPVVICEPCPQG